MTNSKNAKQNHVRGIIPSVACKLLLLLVGVMVQNYSFGQASNPVIQTLPYNFTTYTGTSFPASMTVGKASSTSLVTTDFTLDAANGSSTEQWDDEGTNGVSYQGSSGNESGTFKTRMNTTGLSNIAASWTARRIVNNSGSSNYLELQWRNGNSGAWNNVSNDQFDSDNSSTSFYVILPSGANNLADLQVRWIYYQQSHSFGSRDRVAVDDIKICAAPTATASNGGAICSGNTLNLSSTPSGMSYSWSGPNGFTSSSQNPSISNAPAAANGTYTVTITDGSGCSASTTTAATVTATPTATASNNGAICTGATLNLTSGPSSQTSYQWSGPAGYTSTTQNPSRSNAITAYAGIYTVTVTNSGCSSTASTTVTVNTTPTASIGSNSPLCVGNALNLTSGGGSSYSWSGPSGYTSTSQNPGISNAQLTRSGTYAVTVTNSGCSSTASTTVVMKQTSVTATASPSSTCAGNSIGLISAPVIAQSNYNSMTIPDNNSTGISTPIVIAGMSGNLNNTSIKIVSVKLNITHTYDADLDIYLVAPDNTQLALSTDNGGSSNNYTNTVFLNGASTNITAGSAPFTGNYAPESAFSTLNGKNPNGTWNLKVVDDASNDNGSLGNWEIIFADNNGFAYSWSSTPSGFTATSQNPSAVHTQTSTYSVSTTGFGCSASNTTSSVIANPAPDLSASSNSPVCEGIDVNFSATNNAPGQETGNTYSWNGPNGFTSTQQNPNLNGSNPSSSGTYTVIITNQYLCTATYPVTVTVNPHPSISVASLTNVSCNGFNDAQFTINATGGTAPYLFTDGSNFNVDGIFTSISPGAYSVIVYDNNGCDNSIPVSITEPDVLALSPTNNSPLCEGLNLEFAANIAGGTLPYNISWTGPNGFTSGNDNNTISSANPLATGNYILSLTDANGCVEGTTASLIVDQAATVSAGSDQSLCNPATLNISGSRGGSASTSMWTSSGDGSFDDAGSVAAIYTPGANDVAAGIVTLTLTTDDPAGACVAVIDDLVARIPATIPATPGTVAGPSSVCVPANNITLTAPPALYAETYSWILGPTTNGVTFTGPTDQSTIIANFGATPNTSYGIRCYAINACGTSTGYGPFFTRRAVSTPLNPAGPNVACSNDVKTYTIPAVTGAESYTWTAPAGSLINGNPTPYTAPNLTSVNVTFPSGFTTGQVCVAASVGCYTTINKCYTVSTATVNLGLINGATSTVCPGQTYTYSVTPVNGAFAYNWTLPANVTGSSSTNSINVTIQPGFTSADIMVSATSVCGTPSALRTRSLVTGTPARPATVTGAQNGLCQQASVYTCPSQAGVTYNWTVPSGASIINGNGSNAISVQHGIFGVGSLCVNASNLCGASANRCITVRGAPNTPNPTTALPGAWCANTDGIEFTADVSNLTGTYTLSWIYPPSNIATYVLGGGNSTSLILDWKTGSGNVIVTASNACGSGSRHFAAANSCREGVDADAQNVISSSDNSVSVYPNPARDVVNVSFKSESDDVVSLKLIDVAGRVVLSENVNSQAGFNHAQLNVSKLAKGAYLLQLNDNKQVRIIIE